MLPCDEIDHLGKTPILVTVEPISHKGDILGLAEKQIEVYGKTSVHQIYPEYWVIKTGKFRNQVNNKLDEWVYFLKNAEIKPSFSAKGLKEANEKLDKMKLPEKERKAYDAYLRHMMNIASRKIILLKLKQKTLSKKQEKIEMLNL